MARPAPNQATATLPYHPSAKAFTGIVFTNGDERSCRHLRCAHLGTAGTLCCAASARSHEGTASARAKRTLTAEYWPKLGAPSFRGCDLRVATQLLAAFHLRHWRNPEPAFVRLCHPLPVGISHRSRVEVADQSNGSLRNQHPEQLGHDRFSSTVRRGPSVDRTHAPLPRRPLAEIVAHRRSRIVALSAFASGRHDQWQRLRIQRSATEQLGRSKIVPIQPIQQPPDRHGHGLHGSPPIAPAWHPLASQFW